MGCDIHRYVEYKRKKDIHWKSTPISGLGTQNYTLFGFLEEGIRENHNPEKYYIHEALGLPDDIGFYAEEDFYLTVNDEYINDDRCISVEKANEYINKWPYLKIIKNNKGEILKIQNPNWYGMTYINFEEFNRIIESFKRYLIDNNIFDYYIPTSVLATYHYMKTYNDRGYDTRMVYWFDS